MAYPLSILLLPEIIEPNRGLLESSPFVVSADQFLAPRLLAQTRHVIKKLTEHIFSAQNCLVTPRNRSVSDGSAQGYAGLMSNLKYPFRLAFVASCVSLKPDWPLQKKSTNGSPETQQYLQSGYGARLIFCNVYTGCARWGFLTSET